MKLITADQHASDTTSPQVLAVANDVDPRTLSLDGVTRIDLHFPTFTDGRAHSQAFLLSRRLGFRGEIRATGDILVDQLPLLARNGFTVAALRADQDLAVAERQLARYPAFYQGDAVHVRPHFAKAA